MPPFENTLTYAQRLDSEDPLKDFRREFHLPSRPDNSPFIYFCGNSLGLQPIRAQEYVMNEMEDWALLGVEGHLRARQPWLPYHELLTERTARIAGSLPSEVVVMNTLTVNLHLMMVSFYRPTRERHKIVIEAQAFPSDRYAVSSHIRYHGFDPAPSLVELQPREGEESLRTADIEDFVAREGQSVSLVMLGGVNYYTGQVFEMERITRAARAAGCNVGYDLAHAIGNIPLRLHDWGPDFAVWCSYKYLNAGPGSTAGCFVHERHSRSFDLPRFTGWWGHNKSTRFQMPQSFDPLPGAEGWQISNPPILPLAALRASMEVFDAARIDRLRAKSVLLTSYLEFILQQYRDRGVSILTPMDPEQRGCQLSVKVERNPLKVFHGLLEAGVICDWRDPDVIRLAPVPLYNTFQEVYQFGKIFADVLGRNS